VDNGKQFSLQHGRQNSLFRISPVKLKKHYRSRNDKEKNVQTDSRLKEKGLYQCRSGLRLFVFAAVLSASRYRLEYEKNK